MGLTRKLMSVSTLGAVDFRSDKERTAAYTQAAKRESKKQTRLMQQQTRAVQQQARAAQHGAWAQPQYAPQPPAPAAPQMPPAGWYPDQQDPSIVRWFDGLQWTGFTQPRA